MTAFPRRRGAALITGGVAAAVLLAACGGGSETSSESTAAASAAPAASVAAGCEAYASYGTFDGAKVTLFTSILPPEQQLFETAWAEFESCTGIDVVYEGSDQFEAQLPTRIAGGNAPDLAFIPQPGLLKKLVEGGGPLPAPESVAANVDQYWNPAWKTYGTIDGTFYAAPLGSNMKSFVWYSPKKFAEWGFEVPTTWDGLWEISDKMVEAGVKPWCGGIESGGATGWPATDWMEQIMLRMYGGETYDKWVSGELPFTSPEVTAAMDTLAGWMKNPDYVNGGYGNVQTIATTAFQDAGKGILSGECGMLQQASFYANFWANFQEGATVAADGDAYAFYLPAMDEAVAPQPVVGGGEFVTAFSDRPEVVATQTYLSSPEFATSKVKGGTWVSANSGVPLDAYAPGSIDQLSAEFLTNPQGTFRFDASDIMPTSVGQGSFWTGMTAWFAEDKPTAEVLKQIQADWPAS